MPTLNKETGARLAEAGAEPADRVLRLEVPVDVPLVVDLDQTLLLTDSLYESFARLLFSEPRAALTGLGSLAAGRAAFKARLAGAGALDATTLPYRAELIDLIRREKVRGRAIHLVTAADQAISNAVAAHLGLFDTAVGSDGTENLKGAKKAAYLRAQFPDGFLYAGDSAADVPVFEAALGVVLCDADPGVARAAAAGTTVLADLRRPQRGLKVWLRALRVHQWSKNLLVFVPLIVGHDFGNQDSLLKTFAGFVILCLLASATYMINDIADLESDRLHHTKRTRPFASGALPIAFGLAAAPLVIGACLIAAWLLAPPFFAVVVAYLVLTLAYSFGLKQVPLLDVFLIGSLFTLRVAMGNTLADLAYSPWLMSFSFAFFLSLALAKRHVEVARASRVDGEDVVGRGYRGSDWPLTIGFGIGSGMTSILIMLLYLTNDAAPSGFYNSPVWLYAVPLLLIMWLMRIWLMSNRMELHDDPVVFALRDPASLAIAAFSAVAFLLAL